MTQLPPLLDPNSIEHYRAAAQQAVALVADHLAAVDAPSRGADPDDLRAAVARADLDGPPLAALDDALAEVADLYLGDAVHFHHPRYMAHLNCPVALPALVAEAILAPVNSSLDTFDQSGGATLIEQQLVAWTAGRIGFDAGAADGVFTSGGTQSNLQALLLAREELGPDHLKVHASQDAHFSVVKSARVLGLGENAVVAVPVDGARRMDVGALRAAVRAPGVIVATAGTTDFGAIDPLGEIAAVARDSGSWLHVDAAYGCGLLVSPEAQRRALLGGIEHADSVTVDFHKAFFQPVSSSALVVRDARTLRHVTHHADYLNPRRTAVPNQVDKSLQTTRRFDALKLWLTLRVLGAEQVGALFETPCALAREAYALIDDDPRFVVEGPPPELGAVVFRIAGASGDDQRRARAELARSGAGMVAATRVQGRQCLKLTLLNPATTLEDVDAVLSALAAVAVREEVVA